MKQLRPYQQKANNAVYNYFENYNGNPIIVLPTGTGKSICIAKFCQDAIKSWPDTRIIIATHSRELVRQNYLELCELWPMAPAGIYSAGLNRRDEKAQILFCGIQSAYDKAFDFQKCDLLFIDEVHTLSHKSETMWGKFLKELKIINPNMKLVGYSATPFRMDCGVLTDKGRNGEPPIFTDIAYDYSILNAIKDGYLCEIISKNMSTILDVSGVQKRGGEFISGELEKAINIDEITKAAIDEIITYGANRKTWLLFCSGVNHAKAVSAEINSRGIECAVLTGETPDNERDEILRRFNSGELRAVANNNIMTTGTNILRIDLIAGLRPTGSPGLHIQMVGRGMRNFEGKENCLYLDFAKNVFRFGPLDKIKPKKPGSGEGDAPVKVCEAKTDRINHVGVPILCNCVCFAGCRVCPDCGTPFPEPQLKIKKDGDAEGILSNQIQPEWHNVLGTSYRLHSKEGKIPSMCVTYNTMNGQFREWVCFSHSGYPRERACHWHKERLPNKAVPKDVTEALSLRYPDAARVLVRANGKFFDILRTELREKAHEIAAVPAPYELSTEDEIKW